MVTIKNETILLICDLAKSKGKVTRYFFLEGLRMLLLYRHIESFKIDNDISDEMFDKMESYVRVLVLRSLQYYITYLSNFSVIRCTGNYF